MAKATGSYYEWEVPGFGGYWHGPYHVGGTAAMKEEDLSNYKGGYPREEGFAFAVAEYVYEHVWTPEPGDSNDHMLGGHI